MATDDLRESVRHLPDQLRDIAVAAADLDQLPDAGGIESVVVLGTGGARVAGDVNAVRRSPRSHPVALASPVM